MKSVGDTNFLSPYRNFSLKSLGSFSSFLWSSFEIWSCLVGRSGTRKMVVCSLCWCILPILTIQCTIVLAMISCLALIYLMVGLFMAVIFSLIGICPSFILTIGITSITFYRIPFNIYYTLKVLYFSICITRTLKCVMILLSIPILISTPLLTFICVFLVSLSVSFLTSFTGSCLKPWTQFPIAMSTFWKVYVTDAEAFAHDYGHPTGIPDNWNGTVFGKYFNPVSITVAVVLFLYGLITMTVGVCLVVSIKFIPLYIFTLLKCADRFGLMLYTQYYFETIFFWIKLFTIKRYCDVFKSYIKFMPLRNISGSSCVEVTIFWWAYLLGTLSWIVFLPVIIVGPFLTLIMGLALIVTALPLIYLGIWLFWCFFPVIACCIIICIGPFFSVRCPFVALKHNILLPGQLKKSFHLGLYEVINFLKYIDRETTKISIGDLRLFSHDHIIEWDKDFSKQRKVDYWKLVHTNLISVKNELISCNWLSEDDIISFVPNALIAIPAVAIVDVIVSSIKHDINNTSLIYWSADNQCDDESRDRQDNIISVFWPHIMEIKKSLVLLLILGKRYNEDHIAVNAKILYIKAKLCSGDDYQSDALSDALVNHDFNDEQLVLLNRICAKVANTVIPLLRVEEMKNQLHTIMD